MRPSPPNFFMSLQNEHSPHSVRVHAVHRRHRTLRRRTLLDTVNPPDGATTAGDDFAGESQAELGGNSAGASSPPAALCSTELHATTPSF